MLFVSLHNLGALLVFVLPVTKAHQSIPSGITCGSQFSFPDTPLTIPNPKISWANYNIHTCEHPVTWYEAEAEKNQELKFTSLVPVIERFVDVLMTSVFIGPGLPTLPGNSNVPNSVAQYAEENGFGGVVFKSNQDQTTCDHLTSKEMIDTSAVLNGRCTFYEPFSNSSLWVLSDDIIKVPESAIYKIALYEENGFTAKASFACCDWPEDFLTPYDIPESECSACGSNSSNPAWTSLFYEHKTMTQYGGFPPLEDCNAKNNPTDYPSDEKCPVLNLKEDKNPESCDLGCDTEGECHSHNVFGECTHLLDWGITPKFGEAAVNRVIIFKGDTIRFTASSNVPHNLFEFTDKTASDQCDFSSSSILADVGEIFSGHEITFSDAGLFYFSCSITGHCQAGQKVIVEVKDATDGLRCHDHNVTGYISAKCLFGVNARALASTSFLSINANECADFCTPAAALAFMMGVEEGSCSELGFVYNATNIKVRFPNSPSDTDLVIVSNNNDDATSQGCHCHSYEEISCPEDEAQDYFLYDEHIEEIENYCMGILDGKEEDCAYKCFQPMEVLHLHYLECPSRTKDVTYQAIDATNKCHIAAPAPEGDVPCSNNYAKSLSPTTSASPSASLQPSLPPYASVGVKKMKIEKVFVTLVTTLTVFFSLS